VEEKREEEGQLQGGKMSRKGGVGVQQLALLVGVASVVDSSKSFVPPKSIGFRLQ